MLNLDEKKIRKGKPIGLPYQGSKKKISKKIVYNQYIKLRKRETTIENKLIKINSMETLENGFISVNADFGLIAGSNMDRLTEDRYE